MCAIVIEALTPFDRTPCIKLHKNNARSRLFFRIAKISIPFKGTDSLQDAPIVIAKFSNLPKYFSIKELLLSDSAADNSIPSDFDNFTCCCSMRTICVQHSFASLSQRINIKIKCFLKSFGPTSNTGWIAREFDQKVSANFEGF